MFNQNLINLLTLTYVYIQKSIKKSSSSKKNKVSLGKNFPNTYLSIQESKCLLHFILGFNNEQTSKNLALSDQTIQFYKKSMYQKLNVNSIEELMKKIRQTDFLNHLQIKQ